MITPGQASETLSIPASTLRRLANTFEKYLSPQTGSHRAYTLEDINTFRKIKEMLHQGLNYKDIKKQLEVVETPADVSKEIATIPGIIQALQIATDQLATMQTHIEKQDQKIKQLEDWINTPWYKRINKKPPAADESDIG